MPKRGDRDPLTGRIFLCRQKSCPNGERWVSPREWHKRKRYARDYARSEAYRAREKRRRNTDAEREKRNDYARQWRKTRAVRDRIAAYLRTRRKRDPLFVVKDRLRSRVNEHLRRKGRTRGRRLASIVGCTWPEFLRHLEQQFKPGMTWSNRSQWEIDHIVPLSSAKSVRKTYRLFHYRNLRPLWISENRKKGCRNLEPRCNGKS